MKYNLGDKINVKRNGLVFACSVIAVDSSKGTMFYLLEPLSTIGLDKKDLYTLSPGNRDIYTEDNIDCVLDLDCKTVIRSIEYGWTWWEDTILNKYIVTSDEPDGDCGGLKHL